MKKKETVIKNGMKFTHEDDVTNLVYTLQEEIIDLSTFNKSTLEDFLEAFSKLDFDKQLSYTSVFIFANESDNKNMILNDKRVIPSYIAFLQNNLSKIEDVQAYEDCAFIRDHIKEMQSKLI